MSRLDDDLEAASREPAPTPTSTAGAGADFPEAPPVVAESGPRHRGRPERAEAKGNVKLLVGLLVAGVAIVALAMTFRESVVYAKTVDQLMADQQRMAGRAVRVEGNLVKGSLVHQDTPCEYRFELEHGGATVPVRYANCVVPDTFRDVPGMDVKVTVEGKLAAGGRFEATQVMAKCPSKYEMKEKAAAGETMPHAATRQN
jgi:cytochrome c-type biogenesis protein CcmE